MQDQPSRPSQKSDTSVQPYAENPFTQAREAAVKALILNPDLPARKLAEMLYTDEPELAGLLHKPLVEAHYARLIRLERRKQKRERRAQLSLPGFELLDPIIKTAGGKPVSLEDANYYTVRTYYWSLMKKHADRRREDPKIKQAKSLMDQMQKHAHEEPGITVRQVLMLENL